jgi:hypothetical protein
MRADSLLAFATQCLVFLSPAPTGALAVWSQLGGVISEDLQANFSMPDLTTSINTQLLVALPALNGCLVSDGAGSALSFERAHAPPCFSRISEPSIAFYTVGPSWYVTGFHDVDDGTCNATALQVVQQSGTCGTAAGWLTTSRHPTFAALGRRRGYKTRFAVGPGVVLLGGTNATTGAPLKDVWASCIGNVCTYDEWRRAQDLPDDCADTPPTSSGPGSVVLPFILNYNLFIACGSSAPQAAFSIYALIGGSFTWSFMQQISLGPSFAAPLNGTQFESLHGPTYGKAPVQAETAQPVAAFSASVPLEPRGGCLVAIGGGPGQSTGSLAVTYDGLLWRTFPVPFSSRTRAGLTFWPTGRLAVLGGVGADGAYVSDAWAADSSLCCATACTATGECEVCSGRGTCLLDGRALCTCDDGFEGDTCDKVVPTATPSPTPSPSSASHAAANVIDGYVTPAIIGGSAVAAVVAVAVLALIAQRRGMFVSNKAATDNVPEYGATRTR